jgi:hypothetical protein
VARKKITQLEKNCLTYQSELREGSVLCIDPSSGSLLSQPGFALYQRGNLVEAGTIKVSPGQGIHRRLFDLRRSLVEEFATPDLLVVEDIPPFMGKGFNKSILNLHYSVGVILSVFYAPVLKVTPVSWHKRAPEGYVKSDRNDAIMLGYTPLSLVLEGEALISLTNKTTALVTSNGGN